MGTVQAYTPDEAWPTDFLCISLYQSELCCAYTLRECTKLTNPREHVIAGKDVWWGELPDVGACCDRCLNMNRYWVQSGTRDKKWQYYFKIDACFGYTYSLYSKQCYLKDSEKLLSSLCSISGTITWISPGQATCFVLRMKTAKTIPA